MHNGTTITQFIIEEQRQIQGATGELTSLLNDIVTSIKVISNLVNKGELVGVLGSAGSENVQGETQKKMDIISNDVFLKANEWAGHLSAMASEEMDEIYPIPEQYPRGKYMVVFDPLDGSSNIDVNVSIGTIFSIFRKISSGERGTLEDCLQPGRELVAGGYVLYGSSTMLVYSAGAGVHGFTLDPSIGEFLLSHKNIKLPDPPQRYYSVNEAYFQKWARGQQRMVACLKGMGDKEVEPFRSRYIGSLVADFHRTLLKGGIFMYPRDSNSPDGKLRLLYEAMPIALICEQAGGRASDGMQDILEVVPRDLHQRTPLYLGTREFVDMAEEFLHQDPELPK